MREHAAVFLFVLVLLMVSSSASTNVRTSANSATGIGIRKDGPLEATTGTVIQYAITVYNLGALDINDVTITDVFPNGASAQWTIDHLAPMGQSGDSFKISGIDYTVRLNDVLPIHVDNPCVINNARVEGYVYAQDATLLVHAETQFTTRVLAVPVGGYALTPKTTRPSSPIIVYSVLTLIMTTALAAIRHNGASSRGVSRQLENRERRRRNLGLFAGTASR